MSQILIIGSNGVVGNDLMRLLNEDENHYKLTLVNTKNCIQEYQGDKIVSKTFDEIKDKNFKVIFNCATSEISKKIIEELKYNYYIDNSSYLRRDEKIPLVIPEINFKYSQNYANPNCTSIILSLFLNTFKNIKRVNVSTYQALSGAGKEKLTRFLDENISALKIEPLKPEGKLSVDKQLALNFYPHESELVEGGFNGEEEKVMYETKRLTGLEVFVTCIRVPVIRCHGESVTIEFNKILEREEVIELISKNSNLILSEEIDCVSSEYSTKVSVGHIRQNPHNLLEWNFFIVGDQLTRGAAYNAYKIMKEIENYNDEINNRIDNVNYII